MKKILRRLMFPKLYVIVLLTVLSAVLLMGVPLF